MRQLLQKTAILLAIASLAACSAPQSHISQMTAGAPLQPADTILGHP